MSFEFFITADRPVPEVKRSGLEVLTVKDMIRMNVPDGPIPWKEMNEDAEVLYGNDIISSSRIQIESASNAIKIMRKYTDLNYIYTFDVSQLNFANELFNYITSLDKDINLEIWHIWLGYDNKNEVFKRKNLLHSTLTLSDFKVVHNESWCIAISNLKCERGI